MSTWADVIRDSLLEIGVKSEGEAVTSAEQVDAMRRLKGMLGVWSLKGLLVPGLTSVGYVVDDNISTEYTLGAADLSPAPDIVLAKPINSIYALNYRRHTAQRSRPLKRTSYIVLSETRFTELPNPTEFFYDADYPYARILFDRTPMRQDRFEIVYRGTFDDISAMDKVSATVPEEFREPIMLNLAVKMAPSFGVKDGRAQGLSSVTIRSAADGMRSIIKRNWQNPETRLDPALLNYEASLLSGGYRHRRY